MFKLLQSQEAYLLLMLISKPVWFYFSGKYTATFFTEYTLLRVFGERMDSITALLWAIMWACFFVAC
ncbi:hypothetical protein GCM10023189_22680 [Nibrella saemangeumensis]|uniref:Uncharacterized protein n=1 Tax=Nibrella saemangeumensis TaxID=1084526 RepID=A0ABP8MS57_9BACT